MWLVVVDCSDEDGVVINNSFVVETEVSNRRRGCGFERGVTEGEGMNPVGVLIDDEEDIYRFAPS